MDADLFVQLYNDLSNFRSHAKKVARVALAQQHNFKPPPDLNAAQVTACVKDFYTHLVKDSIFLHHQNKEVRILICCDTD